MAITSATIRIAIAILIYCAGTSAGRATLPTDAAIKITGRAIFEKGRKSRLPEFRIEQFRQLAGTVEIPKTDCVNAIFSINFKNARQKRIRLNKQAIVAEGVLVDFMDYVNTDPISATVSSFQNRCQNKYVLIVTKMTS